MTTTPPDNPATTVSPRPGLAITWILLTLILVVAVSARCYKLSSDRFWFDEIWSMEIAGGHGAAHFELPCDQVINPPIFTHEASKQPWTNIWTNMTGDIHPPVYFILLRWWLDAFGWSNSSAQMLSVVLSVLGIVVFFDLMNRLHGRWAALTGAAVMALAGFQLEFAREARCYMLQQLLILLAADMLIQIEQQGIKWWRVLVLVVSIVGAILSHYFSLAVLAGLFVYVLIRFPKPAKIKTVGAFFLAGAIVSAIWLPKALAQVKTLNRGTEWFVNNDPESHGPIWYLAQLPTRVIGPSHQEFIPDRKYPLQLTGIAVFLLPLILWRSRRDLQLWAAMLWSGVGLLLVYDLYHHTVLSNFPRYHTPVVCAIYAILCVPGKSKLLTHFWRPLVIFCAGVSYAYCVWPWPPSDPDWKGAARFIESKSDMAQSDTPGCDFSRVVLFAGAAQYSAINNPRGIFICDSHWMKTSSPIVLLSKPIDTQLDLELRKFKHVYLHEFPGNPAVLMPNWKIIRSFGTFTVSAGMVYELSPADSLK